MSDMRDETSGNEEVHKHFELACRPGVTIKIREIDLEHLEPGYYDVLAQWTKITIQEGRSTFLRSCLFAESCDSRLLTPRSTRAFGFEPSDNKGNGLAKLQSRTGGQRDKEFI